MYTRVVALASELQIHDLQHNVFLLDCFESDMVFTLLDSQGRSKPYYLIPNTLIYSPLATPILVNLTNPFLLYPDLYSTLP